MKRKIITAMILWAVLNALVVYAIFYEEKPADKPVTGYETESQSTYIVENGKIKKR
jgi:hypothetical protein